MWSRGVGRYLGQMDTWMVTRLMVIIIIGTMPAAGATGGRPYRLEPLR